MDATRNENLLLTGVASGCVVCSAVLGLLFLWAPTNNDFMLKLLLTLIAIGGASILLLVIRWLRRALRVREPGCSEDSEDSEDSGEARSGVLSPE